MLEQGPGTSAPEWNAAMIHVIRYTCGFLVMMCPEKSFLFRDTVAITLHKQTGSR